MPKIIPKKQENLLTSSGQNSFSTKKKIMEVKVMKDIKYSITNRMSVFVPHERNIAGFNLPRFMYIRRMKHVDINAGEEKLSVEGHKTMMAGDYHIDIKREDFRGSSVNYAAFNLLGIIFGALVAALGIFALIVYIADLFNNDGDTLPLGLGIIFIILGAIIIFISCLKRTTLTLRFVDKNSNSVRSIAFRVIRNAPEYYKTAKEFTEKLWV